MADSKENPRKKKPETWLRPDEITSPEEAAEARKRHYGATRIRLVPRFPKTKQKPGEGPDTEKKD